MTSSAPSSPRPSWSSSASSWSTVRSSFALVAALLAGTAAAADIAGRIHRVHDGDTLTIATGRERITVRLQDIDAPELAQPYGWESRARLRALCPAGAAAEADGTKRDRYGRVVARVRCAGVDVQEALIRDGAAWVFVRYAPKNSPLFQLEAEARTAGRGLWSSPSPIPPWDYRRSR